jgi:putative protease
VTLIAAAVGVQSEVVLSGPFEPARQPEKSAAAIRQCFEKLGHTDWKLNQLTLAGPAVFVPVSVLNDARRRLIDDFSNVWRTVDEAPSPGPAAGCRFHHLETFPAAPAPHKVFWSVKSRSFQALESIDEFVLEVDPLRSEEIEKARTFYADKLRLALPVIVRKEDVDAFQKLISQSRLSVSLDQNERDARSTFLKWEAANIGGLNLLSGQKDITADWPLYTMNTQAALQWRDQGVQQFVLSPEDDAENLFALIEQLGDAAIIPVYQHTLLMISATRPAASGDELTDRSRRAFRVERTGREFVLINETPFSLTDHLGELKAHGARRFRIDLSHGIDSPQQAADIVRRITAGNSVPGHFGNFLRSFQ